MRLCILCLYATGEIVVSSSSSRTFSTGLLWKYIGPCNGSKFNHMNTLTKDIIPLGEMLTPYPTLPCHHRHHPRSSSIIEDVSIIFSSKQKMITDSYQFDCSNNTHVDDSFDGYVCTLSSSTDMRDHSLIYLCNK